MNEQTEAAAPAAKEPKVPRRGIGTVIKEAILNGATNEEALNAALAEFPNAGTSASTVSWYRNQLRKEGKTVPTARSLRKAAEAAAAPATAPADAPEAEPAADPLA
jgi:hypothetical protein